MSAPRLRPALSAAIILLLVASRTMADDFFNLVAVGSGGTAVANTGGNIIHLTDNLISLNSSFIFLAGQNINASMSWGGVPNAIRFTENAAQTVATLTFPTTGFTTTFVGTSASDLQQQVHDFIQKDGEQAYAQFLKTMNQLSPVATLDGNPQSSTALIATDVFNRFGIENQQPTQYRSYSDGAYIGVSADGGSTRADGIDGSWAGFSLDTGARFGSHVALSFGTTLAYRNTENSQAYTVAEEVALPVTIINNRDNGISWQVAPWAFAGLSASYDQAAGGILVGGGATSSLALHLNGLTITLGDQISYTGNVAVNVDGYSFDTDIDQWILKDGLDASYQFPGTPFFVEGGIAYSNFLDRAAVPNYWTPTLGVGIATGRYSSIQISYQGDFAKQYNQNGGELAFVMVY
jgi:putative lipoic acid-binding regulatory protein